MNYDELAVLIADYTESTEESFLANIPNFVRFAEEKILYAVKLPYFRRTVSGHTNPGVKYLTVPTDFLSTDSISVIVAGLYSPLLNKEPSFAAEAYPSSAQGVPKYYSYLDDTTMQFTPVPDDTYDLEMLYYYYPQSIVDTNYSWLGTNAEEALLYGSLLEAYTYLKGEKDLMDQYKEKYQEAISGLEILAYGRDRGDESRHPLPRRYVP